MDGLSDSRVVVEGVESSQTDGDLGRHGNGDRYRVGFGGSQQFSAHFQDGIVKLGLGKMGPRRILVVVVIAAGQIGIDLAKFHHEAGIFDPGDGFSEASGYWGVLTC